MKRYSDCPQILRDFLTYHETIKGQSQLTISEYYLDLRMFLRFMKLMRNEMPMKTNLDDIDIRDVDITFVASIKTSDIFDFLSYLANDRIINPDSAVPEYGALKTGGFVCAVGETEFRSKTCTGKKTEIKVQLTDKCSGKTVYNGAVLAHFAAGDVNVDVIKCAECFAEINGIDDERVMEIERKEFQKPESERAAA